VLILIDFKLSGINTCGSVDSKRVTLDIIGRENSWHKTLEQANTPTPQVKETEEDFKSELTQS
jgi:hypothetical protein